VSDHISTEEAERIAKRLERMSPWLGIEVARKQLYEASDALRSLAAERDALREAILWALGERGEFPPRGDGDPPYGWRKELRRRAALGENQP